MEPFNISVKRFDEFAAEYAQRFNSIDPYISALERFCALIPQNNPRILELACGPGNITKYIKQKFPNSKYIAIDLAERMIEIAKAEVSDVEFRMMDMREIGSLETKFDAIICSFGLPFLSKYDTYELISNGSKLLQTNGVIYISTMEGDETKAGFESTSFTGEAKVYFNYHQQKEIERALIENNFNTINIERQDFKEPDGTTLVDMIFIATKK